jgi:hypothetical protein
MRSSSYLIPQVVVNHFNDINNGGSGLFRDGRFIHGDIGGNWTLQFQHAGGRGNGFDTMVKVSKSILDTEDALEVANRTCWIFECRGYGRISSWGEEEYSRLWERINQTMGDVDHWNVLLMLAPGEDVEKVKEFLQLPEETTDVFNLSYVFGPQCKEKGYEVRG